MERITKMCKKLKIITCENTKKARVYIEQDEKQHLENFVLGRKVDQVETGTRKQKARKLQEFGTSSSIVGNGSFPIFCVYFKAVRKHQEGNLS